MQTDILESVKFMLEQINAPLRKADEDIRLEQTQESLIYEEFKYDTLKVLSELDDLYSNPKLNKREQVLVGVARNHIVDLIYKGW